MVGVQNQHWDLEEGEADSGNTLAQIENNVVVAAAGVAEVVAAMMRSAGTRQASQV